MHVADPALLLVGVLVAVEESAIDDGLLQPGVVREHLRIGAEGVAKGEVASQLGRAGLDVAVDAERRPVDGHRADEHRPRGRPRIRAWLVAEAEPLEHRDHAGQVVGRRDDGQVDDALARQTGHRGAADVLDDEVRAPLVDEGRDRCRDVL